MLIFHRLFRYVKLVFAALIVLCLFILFPLFYMFQTRKTNLFEEDFPYNEPSIPFSEENLSEDIDACFFNPDVLFKTSNIKDAENFNYTRTDYLNLKTKNEKFRWFPLFHVLWDLSSFMVDRLNLQLVLLEPAILFCMLSPAQRDLLLSRNFTIESYLKKKKILTLGVMGDNVKKLQKENVQSVLHSSNFVLELIESPAPRWMAYEEEDTTTDHIITHVFIRRRDWTLHLVVLHRRGSFFWHAGLRSQELQNVQDFLFVEADSAYENFQFTSLGFKGGGDLLNSLFIPSNPQFFLFEIQTSRFLECNSTIVNRFLQSQGSPMPNSRSLSVDKFNYRTYVAIQELKIRLNPYLIRFWMWSGTMLGWYRQCDVIPYTSDIDFGAWAYEVDDLDALLRVFTGADHIKLKEKMGFVECGLEFNLNCHSLRVDLFFLYLEQNGTWYAGHRPSRKYYFKYHHPHFSLCSTELLDQKVLVPCETESVISAEYGPQWMKPVTSWSYESSIYNRGPNIYWNESQIDKVYSLI